MLLCSAAQQEGLQDRRLRRIQAARKLNTAGGRRLNSEALQERRRKLLERNPLRRGRVTTPRPSAPQQVTDIYTRPIIGRL